MSKEVENVATEEFDPTVVLATLVKENDEYFVVDAESAEKSGPCKVSDGWITLVPNRANRQYVSVNKAEKVIAEAGEMPLCYKATKHIGSTGSKMPNEKLISYLSEEDQAEYKAIIERAKAAKAADKKQPMTEREKLEAKIAKAQEALNKLLAENID